MVGRKYNSSLGNANSDLFMEVITMRGYRRIWVIFSFVSKHFVLSFVAAHLSHVHW